jgi:hypothetical protein
MNKELLRKLQLQAGGSHYPDINPQIQELFAKLIVQECLEQIDTVRDGCDEDGDHQQALGADWAGLAVARHFGIEQ